MSSRAPSKIHEGSADMPLRAPLRPRGVERSVASCHEGPGRRGRPFDIGARSFGRRSKKSYLHATNRGRKRMCPGPMKICFAPAPPVMPRHSMRWSHGTRQCCIDWLVGYADRRARPRMHCKTGYCRRGAARPLIVVKAPSRGGSCASWCMHAGIVSAGARVSRDIIIRWMRSSSRRRRARDRRARP